MPTICANNLCFENFLIFTKTLKNYAVQLQTVDHSVRWSMKNRASSDKRCEMQDTPSTWFSNAYCSLGSFPGLRLSEGRYDIKIIIQVCTNVEYAVLSCCTRRTYSYTRPHIVCVSSDTHIHMCCVLSFNTLAITAEHYKFCWPLICLFDYLIRGTQFVNRWPTDEVFHGTSFTYIFYVDLRSSEITRLI